MSKSETPSDEILVAASTDKTQSSPIIVKSIDSSPTTTSKSSTTTSKSSLASSKSSSSSTTLSSTTTTTTSSAPPNSLSSPSPSSASDSPAKRKLMHVDTRLESNDDVEQDKQSQIPSTKKAKVAPQQCDILHREIGNDSNTHNVPKELDRHPATTGKQSTPPKILPTTRAPTVTATTATTTTKQYAAFPPKGPLIFRGRVADKMKNNVPCTLQLQPQYYLLSKFIADACAFGTIMTLRTDIENTSTTSGSSYYHRVVKHTINYLNNEYRVMLRGADTINKMAETDCTTNVKSNIFEALNSHSPNTCLMHVFANLAQTILPRDPIKGTYEEIVNAKTTDMMEETLDRMKNKLNGIFEQALIRLLNHMGGLVLDHNCIGPSVEDLRREWLAQGKPSRVSFLNLRTHTM